MTRDEASRLSVGARVRQVRDGFALVGGVPKLHTEGRWGTVTAPWEAGSMVVQFDDGEVLQLGEHNLGSMWFARATSQERGGTP